MSVNDELADLFAIHHAIDPEEEIPAGFDVTVHDGIRVEHVRGVGVAELRRIADFVWRHSLRFAYRPAEARPERRRYR